MTSNINYVLEGRARWAVERSDCIDLLNQLPADSVDACIFSPPYEDARSCLEDGEDIGIARDAEAWVPWMVDVFRACLRVCKGPIICVCEGRTKDYRYSCSPFLLMADLHRAGICLRKPAVYYRFGIPGGSPDWFKNTWEPVICATRGGRLPWSEPTACGWAPKYRAGGAMSYRTQKGRRVEKERQEYKPPATVNPGNVIIDDDCCDVVHCKVGGGRMGDRLSEESEAPYPEMLVERFLLSFCPPKGVVCDPFAGSGTTAAVALKHNRRFVGCDLRQSQVNLAHRRLRDVMIKMFV